jgi:uncharacterized membrane protein
MDGLFKGALIVALVAGYALASHFALILPNGRAIAAALAVGVPAVALVGFVFQWLHRKLPDYLPLSGAALRLTLATALAVLPVAVFLWQVWPMVLANAQTLYFAQHVGTNGLLAWVFVHTLAAGATPLVVTFARIAHPNLPPEIAAYARKVTVAWTVFFLATCAISVLLFVAAPIAAWSTFAVLLQWPSVAVFFVGEYVLRKRLFRQFDHATMRQGFDAYNQHRVRAQPAAEPKP